MKIQRLTPTGLEAFEEFLDSLNTDSPEGVPSFLLTDPETSTAIGTDIQVEANAFARRFDLAKYLDSKLTDSGLKDFELTWSCGRGSLCSISTSLARPMSTASGAPANWRGGFQQSKTIASIIAIWLRDRTGLPGSPR